MDLDTNLATGMLSTSNIIGINFAMVVSLYLHALSHRQLYVVFSSRVECGVGWMTQLLYNS